MQFVGFLCLTLVLWIGSASAGPGLLFRHGDDAADDIAYPSNIDDESVLASTQFTYRFFGKKYTKLHVGTNGYVTFDEGYSGFNPLHNSAFSGPKMVAPYWSDIYLPAELDGEQIWYRETTHWAMRRRAEKIIQKSFGWCGSNFNPTAVFIVTYQRLASFCQALSCCMTNCNGAGDKRRQAYDTNDLFNKSAKGNTPAAKDGTDWQRNYFQLVLATDGWNTFAITNMKVVEWDCCFNKNTMMFNAGDGQGFYMNPVTDDELVTTSNAEPRGRWIYKISESKIQDPSCAYIGT